MSNDVLIIYGRLDLTWTYLQTIATVGPERVAQVFELRVSHPKLLDRRWQCLTETLFCIWNHQRAWRIQDQALDRLARPIAIVSSELKNIAIAYFGFADLFAALGKSNIAVGVNVAAFAMLTCWSSLSDTLTFSTTRWVDVKRLGRIYLPLSPVKMTLYW